MPAPEVNALAFTSPGTKEKIAIENPVIIASGAVLAPTALINTVSGAAAINLITLPWDGFAGVIILIPTGAFTLATGGVAAGLNKPVGAALAAATVGVPITLTYSARAGLWYGR